MIRGEIEIYLHDNNGLPGWQRLLLRPHGMSEGRVIMHVPSEAKPWMINYRDTMLVKRYATRAQAAQAVWEEGRDEQ